MARPPGFTECVRAARGVAVLIHGELASRYNRHQAVVPHTMRGGGSGGDGRTRTGGAPGDSTPELGEFHALLRSTTRRRVLYYLQAHPETGIEELSDALAGWRAVETGGVVGPREQERLRISLHHAAVPRLADDGVVEYDSERGLVTLQPLPEPLSAIVRRSCAYETGRLAAGGEDHGGR